MATKGLSFWELWLAVQGMEAADTISPDRREWTFKYAMRLEQEITDWYTSVDKTRSKERLEYMKATLENYADQADVYTSLEGIQADNLQAELAASVDDLVSYRNATVDLTTRGSSFGADTKRRAAESLNRPGGSKSNALIDATQAFYQPDPESVEGRMTRANMPSHYYGALEGVNADGLIRYDKTLGTHVAIRDNIEGKQILEEMGAPSGGGATSARRNFDNFAKEALQQAERQNVALRDLDNATGKLKGIVKGPTEDMPALQGRIEAARNDVKKAMQEVEKAYKFLDPDAAKAWEAKYNENSAHNRAREARLEKLNEENFPQDLSLERRTQIFADPEFIEWAEHKGYTRIGRVVDGNYMQGRHDDRLLREFHLEQMAGITPGGRPRYAWTFGGVAKPIALVQYTTAVDADTLELYRSSTGDFFVEVVVDPLTGETTETYLTQEAYAKAIEDEAARKEAVGEGEVPESPWIRGTLGELVFFYNRADKTLRHQDGDEIIEIESDEDGRFLIGNQRLSIEEFPQEVEWEPLPLTEPEYRTVREPDPNIKTITIIGRQSPHHAACPDGYSVMDGLDGIPRCTLVIGEPKYIVELSTEPGHRNAVVAAGDMAKQAGHRVAKEQATRVENEVDAININALEAIALAETDEEKTEIQEEADREVERLRGPGIGKGLRRLMERIAGGGTPTVVEDEKVVVDEEVVVDEVDAVEDEEVKVDLPVSDGGTEDEFSTEDFFIGGGPPPPEADEPLTAEEEAAAEASLEFSDDEVERQAAAERQAAVDKLAARLEVTTDEETRESIQNVLGTFETQYGLTPTVVPEPETVEVVTPEPTPERVVEVPPAATALQRRAEADPEFAALYEQRMAALGGAPEEAPPPTPSPPPIDLSVLDEARWDAEPTETVASPLGDVNLSEVETPTTAELAQDAAGVSPVTTEAERRREEPRSVFDRWTDIREKLKAGRKERQAIRDGTEEDAQASSK